MGLFFAPVDGQGFKEARLGEVRAACFLIDVPKMADGVGEMERFGAFTAEGDRFLIQRPGGVEMTEVTFDLAECFEGLHQIEPGIDLAGKRNSFDQIAPGIVETTLSARKRRLLEEFFGGFEHGVCKTIICSCRRREPAAAFVF